MLSFRKLAVLALACCICLATQQTRAQAPPAPSPTASSAVIGEIHATGSRRYTEAQVATATGLKPGDTVTREQLQDVADRLAHLGVFLTVNYSFLTRGNRITLEYVLQDAPALPVFFDNFPWFTDAEIIAAVRQAVPFFNGTSPTEGTALEDMTAAIAKLIQSRGVAGTVEHEIRVQPGDPAASHETAATDSPLSNKLAGDQSQRGAAPNGANPSGTNSLGTNSGTPNLPAKTSGDAPPSDAADNMVMLFRVAGTSVNIGSLDFGDSLAQTSEKLRARYLDFVGKPFSRYAIEIFEQEQVRPLYFSFGRLRVRFGEPDTGIHGAQPNAPLPSKVTVNIPVTPGPVFHLAGVTWSGNTAFAAPALGPLLLVNPGELADGLKLIAGWLRVEKEFQRRGYVDVKIDPQPQFDDAAGTVAYRVNVVEGPQYHMGELVITGLSLTAERVVRTIWRQARGDVFDAAYFDEMLAKLEKPTTEMFGSLPVHYTEMGHWLRPNLETHTMDVLLDFK
jgi:Surface antigen variable number repeat